MSPNLLKLSIFFLALSLFNSSAFSADIPKGIAHNLCNQFTKALVEKDQETIDILLKNPLLNINCFESWAHLPILLQAIFLKDECTINKLLAAKADVNVIKMGTKQSLLWEMATTTSGGPEVISKLIQLNADPNSQTNKALFTTLLRHEKYNLEYLKILLENGAELSIDDLRTMRNPDLIEHLKTHKSNTKALLEDPNGQRKLFDILKPELQRYQKEDPPREKIKFLLEQGLSLEGNYDGEESPVEYAIRKHLSYLNKYTEALTKVFREHGGICLTPKAFIRGYFDGCAFLSEGEESLLTAFKKLKEDFVPKESFHPDDWLRALSTHFVLFFSQSTLLLYEYLLEEGANPQGSEQDGTYVHPIAAAIYLFFGNRHPEWSGFEDFYKFEAPIEKENEFKYLKQIVKLLQEKGAQWNLKDFQEERWYPKPEQVL